MASKRSGARRIMNLPGKLCPGPALGQKQNPEPRASRGNKIRPPQRPFNYTPVGTTGVGDSTGIQSRRNRISEERIIIGHGQARWEHAWKETLSRRIQHRAGCSILPLDPPTRTTGDTEPRRKSDTTYVPVQPGLAVRLRRRIGPLPMTMPIRVVFVLEEPDRKGFAFGTLAGHPVSGEVAFLVERRPDDSVWFILRSLSGPGKGLWVIAYPMLLLLRKGFRESYLKALADPLV